VRLRIKHLLIALLLIVTGHCVAADASYSIVISKAARTLEVFNGAVRQNSFKIALGTSPVGPKQIEGDRKTPEGSYYVCSKNNASRFYLSLGLSYPNADDAKRGLDAGLITDAQYKNILLAIKRKQVPPWNTSLGGEVMIHGCGTASDWTWGCIALENVNIEALYKYIEIGTPVQIQK